MEILLGGFSAVIAATFTNPIDVIKIRMQLQGELQAKGKYQIHYRNVFHGAYAVWKNEGILALQKGLVPALCFQFVVNGLRLGIYDVMDKSKFIRDTNGNVSPLKSFFVAAFAGAVGGAVSSPFYLVKTQIQSQSSVNIAVGTQHKHQNMMGAFKTIYSKNGVRGLWKGSSSQIPRVSVASAIQLSTFEVSMDFIKNTYNSNNRWLNGFLASSLSGAVVAVGLNPFDLVSTRFYNQGTDEQGRGIKYKTVTDCAIKIWKAEGFSGFFKGVVPQYVRIGPHTLLNMMVWDTFKHYYNDYIKNSKTD